MPLRMGKILLGGKEQENMLRPAGGNGLHEVETRGGASGWWSLKKKVQMAKVYGTFLQDREARIG